MPLVTNGVFGGPGFCLAYTGIETCTLVATCSQANVGLVAGATISGLVTRVWSDVMCEQGQSRKWQVDRCESLAARRKPRISAPPAPVLLDFTEVPSNVSAGAAAF